MLILATVTAARQLERRINPVPDRSGALELVLDRSPEISANVEDPDAQLEIERDSQRIERRPEIARRRRDGDHVVRFSHESRPTTAAPTSWNRRSGV
jgi:hypothetical protein